MAGTRIAVIDDWQNAAREIADWSQLEKRAELVFFQRHYAAGDEDAALRDLRDFDIILITRERSRFSESLINRLPRLKMMSLTGSRAPNVDQEACTRRGIVRRGTRSTVVPSTYSISRCTLRRRKNQLRCVSRA